MKLKRKNIILGVSASIAAYKACDLIRRLQDKSCDVQVVMTSKAHEFIPALTLATLSQKPVLGDMFDAQAWNIPHVQAIKEADVFVVAPATANVIGKMAHGLADDMLTAMFLSARCKVIVAPAMHDEMFLHQSVKENCAKLKKMGVVFVEPIKGKLANGDVGVGHLADVDDIVKAVLKA